jgi:hypothetical protein
MSESFLHAQIEMERRLKHALRFASIHWQLFMASNVQFQAELHVCTNIEKLSGPSKLNFYPPKLCSSDRPDPPKHAFSLPSRHTTGLAEEKTALVWLEKFKLGFSSRGTREETYPSASRCAQIMVKTFSSLLEATFMP